MIKLERSMSHKWIIDKNVNSKDILSEFACLLTNAKSGFGFEEMIGPNISQGRDGEGSTITIGVRLLQTCFYMFGYSTNLDGGKKAFIPSPMTLNILSGEGTDDEISKNYLINLFCMQYPHPYDWTPDCFKIYFGRLIIKLLLDERLQCRLYIDECLWFLPFIETIDEERYEELVSSILEFRSYDYKQKKQLFESVNDYNNLFANVAHEINYYFLRLFADFGVFDLVEDNNHNEGKLLKFIHSISGDNITYRNDAYKSRKNCSGYVTLSRHLLPSAHKLLKTYSPFDTPSYIDGETIYTKEDWLTNIYQTEPLRYLVCVDAQVHRNSEVAETVNNMIYCSKYGSKDGKDFERALKPFIELFKETINVEILSGAGNTDLLCTMEERDSDSVYNMNVEAKTRVHGILSSVDVSRLNKHLKKHASRFCIIVAPKFSKGIIGYDGDISGEKMVTIRSEEFGNYCYKECTSSKSGLADFTSILKIINENMGTDITPKVRMLTESKYGLTIG